VACRAAAVGADATVVCSVVREHRSLAFDVNVRGVFNAIQVGRVISDCHPSEGASTK
jgi:hypothetical protein